jgi:hypothetical protein
VLLAAAVLAFAAVAWLVAGRDDGGQSATADVWKAALGNGLPSEIRVDRLGPRTLRIRPSWRPDSGRPPASKGVALGVSSVGRTRFSFVAWAVPGQPAWGTAATVRDADRVRVDGGGPAGGGEAGRPSRWTVTWRGGEDVPEDGDLRIRTNLSTLREPWRFEPPAGAGFEGDATLTP